MMWVNETGARRRHLGSEFLLGVAPEHVLRTSVETRVTFANEVRRTMGAGLPLAQAPAVAFVAALGDADEFPARQAAACMLITVLI